MAKVSLRPVFIEAAGFIQRIALSVPAVFLVRFAVIFFLNEPAERSIPSACRQEEG